MAFQILLCFLVALSALTVLFATEYAAPGATFDAKTYTTWSKIHSNGSKKGQVNVPVDESGDYIKVFRLDLIGDAKARGIAQGSLMPLEIADFMEVQLNKYFASMVWNIDVSNAPTPLKGILEALKVKGAKAAPAIFRQALDWVYQNELQYMPQNLIDEMEGIAEGMCSSKLLPNCNVTAMGDTIKAMNMVPELIRMACTAYGAWGSATPDAKLVQIRALDFGGGPFANATVLQVNRDPAKPGMSFASITFPGFVGVITGVSQSGIGVSEKVWMTYDRIGIQPGHYDGEPDVFVLRDILENSKNKAEAEAYTQKVKRTFAIWIGAGDYETQTFDLIGYLEDSALVYNDVTMPAMTGQPFIENIAYVDKHPQPSGEGPQGTLPTALNDFHGNITLENTKTILKHHETGDLHIAAYNFGSSEMYVAIGKINEDGQYGPVGGNLDSWKAYNRPYLKFNLEDLWKGN
jgi:hypothetical protein